MGWIPLSTGGLSLHHGEELGEGVEVVGREGGTTLGRQVVLVVQQLVGQHNVGVAFGGLEPVMAVCL